MALNIKSALVRSLKQGASAGVLKVINSKELAAIKSIERDNPPEQTSPPAPRESMIWTGGDQYKEPAIASHEANGWELVSQVPFFYPDGEQGLFFSLHFRRR